MKRNALLATYALVAFSAFVWLGSRMLVTYNSMLVALWLSIGAVLAKPFGLFKRWTEVVIFVVVIFVSFAVIGNRVPKDGSWVDWTLRGIGLFLGTYALYLIARKCITFFRNSHSVS